MLRAYFCVAWLCLAVVADGGAWAAQGVAKKNELKEIHQALSKCLDQPPGEGEACRNKLQPDMDNALRTLALTDPSAAEKLVECRASPGPTRKLAPAGKKCRSALSAYLSKEAASTTAPTSPKTAEASPPPPTTPLPARSEVAPSGADDSLPKLERWRIEQAYPSFWLLVGLPLFVMVVAVSGLVWLYIRLNRFVEAVDERERAINIQARGTGEVVRKHREALNEIRNRLSKLEGGGDPARDGAYWKAETNAVDPLGAVDRAGAVEYTTLTRNPPVAGAATLDDAQPKIPIRRPILPWEDAAEALGAAIKKLYQERVAINPENAQQKILSAVANEGIRDMLQGYQLTFAFYYFSGRMAEQGGDLIFGYLAEMPTEAGWAFPVPRQVGAPSTLAWFEPGGDPGIFRPAKARSSNGDALECMEKGQLAAV